MTYEDIVFDYNNRALDDRTWDMISDRERVEFVLRVRGRQEPVAWSRLDTAKSVITENEDIKRGWDLDGLPFKCLFDSPQPCPSCEVNEAIGAGNTELIEMLQAECASKQAKIDALMLEYCPDEMTAEQLVEWGEHQAPAECPECDEKQSAIDVWEGRYADKTAECEKLKAKIDLTNTLAQQSNQDHLNVRKDYQGEIIKLKAERDELKNDLADMLDAKNGIGPTALSTVISQRDELAAQNQVLRNMVSEVRDPMDMSELPDLSTSILNRVREEALRSAATLCEKHERWVSTGTGKQFKSWDAATVMAGTLASAIRALAADMEAK